MWVLPSQHFLQKVGISWTQPRPPLFILQKMAQATGQLYLGFDFSTQQVSVLARMHISTILTFWVCFANAMSLNATAPPPVWPPVCMPPVCMVLISLRSPFHLNLWCRAQLKVVSLDISLQITAEFSINFDEDLPEYGWVITTTLASDRTSWFDTH